MFNSISNTAGLTLVQLSIIHCVALELYQMSTTDSACWITLPLTHVLVEPLSTSRQSSQLAGRWNSYIPGVQPAQSIHDAVRWLAGHRSHHAVRQSAKETEAKHKTAATFHTPHCMSTDHLLLPSVHAQCNQTDIPEPTTPQKTAVMVK